MYWNYYAIRKDDSRLLVKLMVWKVSKCLALPLGTADKQNILPPWSSIPKLSCSFSLPLPYCSLPYPMPLPFGRRLLSTPPMRLPLFLQSINTQGSGSIAGSLELGINSSHIHVLFSFNKSSLLLMSCGVVTFGYQDQPSKHLKSTPGKKTKGKRKLFLEFSLLLHKNDDQKFMGEAEREGTKDNSEWAMMKGSEISGLQGKSFGKEVRANLRKWAQSKCWKRKPAGGLVPYGLWEKLCPRETGVQIKGSEGFWTRLSKKYRKPS